MRTIKIIREHMEGNGKWGMILMRVEGMGRMANEKIDAVDRRCSDEELQEEQRAHRERRNWNTIPLRVDCMAGEDKDVVGRRCSDEDDQQDQGGHSRQIVNDYIVIH
jgi:hypothetical protein